MQLSENRKHREGLITEHWFDLRKPSSKEASRLFLSSFLFGLYFWLHHTILFFSALSHAYPYDWMSLYRLLWLRRNTDMRDICWASLRFEGNMALLPLELDWFTDIDWLTGRLWRDHCDWTNVAEEELCRTTETGWFWLDDRDWATKPGRLRLKDLLTDLLRLDSETGQL